MELTIWLKHSFTAVISCHSSPIDGPLLSVMHGIYSNVQLLVLLCLLVFYNK